jgi:hypothetical protein
MTADKGKGHMMKTLATKLLFAFILTAITAAAASGQTFVVKIADPPREGTPVGKSMTVTGTATVPDGSHLWVLTRRIDFDGVWWPQGEAKIDPVTKEWRVGATFGAEEDIKWDFQVAAMVFNEEGHIILNDYRKRALKSGDWKPIEIPETAAPPQIIKVKKISHQ